MVYHGLATWARRVVFALDVSKSMNEEIHVDLEKSIRPGLDILANEIVIALKKRTRFRHNAEVYAPGLVVTDRSVSLLRYELERHERLHAELGRYTFASQESFTDVADVRPVIDRADCVGAPTI